MLKSWGRKELSTLGLHSTQMSLRVTKAVHTVNETLRGQTGDQEGVTDLRFTHSHSGERCSGGTERRGEQRPERHRRNRKETAGGGEEQTQSGVPKEEATPGCVWKRCCKESGKMNLRGRRRPRALYSDLIYSFDKHLGPPAMFQALTQFLPWGALRLG